MSLNKMGQPAGTLASITKTEIDRLQAEYHAAIVAVFNAPQAERGPLRERRDAIRRKYHAARGAHYGVTDAAPPLP